MYNDFETKVLEVRDSEIKPLKDVTLEDCLSILNSICPTENPSSVLKISDKGLDGQELLSTLKGLLSEWPEKILQLNFFNCKNLDENLLVRIIKSCPDLHTLSFNNAPTEINDDSIKEIMPFLSKLKVLCLDNSLKMTDKLIMEIAKNCSQLQLLEFGDYYYGVLFNHRADINHNITDKSITELARGCPQLKSLNLNGCERITNKSIIEIAKNCSQLQYLGLGECKKITDEAVKEIVKSCSQLQVLYLKGCLGLSEDLREQSLKQLKEMFREEKGRDDVRPTPSKAPEQFFRL